MTTFAAILKLIGNYSEDTGRFKQISGTDNQQALKIAFVGDSTLDNGFWVNEDKPYNQKTHTVLHQTSLALAKYSPLKSYELLLLAIDGSTTTDVMQYTRLDKVLPGDPDHTRKTVHQLRAVKNYQPDVVVLSVGGNNYREALDSTLRSEMNILQLLLRMPPEQAKPKIKEVFKEVNQTILKEYKEIINALIKENPQLKRLVLVSQYYPSITSFTRYFIYTGFSHLARAEGNGKTAFSAIEDTMNELYREIYEYIATINPEIDIVVADASSSLNPVGGNHTHQIEPNERASEEILGPLIARAAICNIPAAENRPGSRSIARVYTNQQGVHEQLLNPKDIAGFKTKTIAQFIKENPYPQIGLFFSPKTNLSTRYEAAYQLLMGNSYDSDYKGMPALGLLDFSLVTILATYLWRATLDETLPLPLRVATGAIAAPIKAMQTTVGVVIMLALALPILGYHHTLKACAAEKDECNTKRMV